MTVYGPPEISNQVEYDRNVHMPVLI